MKHNPQVKHFLTLITLLFTLLLAGCNSTQKIMVPLYQAHAHNDYEHDRPLFDALDQGFNSVEADIYLIDGQLLVGHDRKDVTSSRTLEALYLAPLFKRFKEHNGSIYPKSEKPLVLLIDFKDKGEIVYPALAKMLKKYEPMLTHADGDVLKHGAVTVIISGSPPYELIVNDKNRLAFIDGRVAKHLNNEFPAAQMPLISANWNNHFSWKGDDEISEKEAIKLKQIVDKTHAQGKLLRFWAIPNNKAAWKVLQEAGIDLINADDLEGLSSFLRAEQR